VTAPLGHHESVLRRINEAIEQGFWPGEDDVVVRIHCECGRSDCNAFVRMRVGEYERMRGHARWFVLCDGHQTPAIERIVERADQYLLVEKTGAAGEDAERSDPRGDGGHPRPSG
jgi:hypothetical protein